jgi:ribosomal protein L24E
MEGCVFCGEEIKIVRIDPDGTEHWDCSNGCQSKLIEGINQAEEIKEESD